MSCSWGENFGLHSEYTGTSAIAGFSDLIKKNEDGSEGGFSVNIANLKENNTYCVVVELVDHPFCDTHLTHLTIDRCTNHVLEPVIIPKCNEGPIIIDSSNVSKRIIIGVLSGLMGIVAIVGSCLIYFRCKHKKRERTERGNNLKPSTKQYLSPPGVYSTPIIKNGALVPNSQASSCTNTLLSKISITMPDIFLLYFPDNKHFEEINAIFRDWLASLGNRVYDMSDSKYDEEISKDPEGWVMKILMKPNIRILVLDSPVAKFSLALASSSTATTSLVSSTASVDSIEHIDEDASKVEGLNSEDMELDDEEVEIRVPLSQKTAQSSGNTLQCNTASIGNQQLPECALEDNRYELRVFAMKMIQSRFVGKYKQVIVLRYDNGLPQPTNDSATKTTKDPSRPPSSTNTNKDVSSTQNSHLSDDRETNGSVAVYHHQDIARKLTPHKQCLVLPQHMPELRSWLRGHGDLHCGNDGLSDFIESFFR